MSRFCGILLVLVVVATYGRAFKIGAGDSACQTMVPGHYGTNPSTESAPFYIDVSSSEYTPGESLTVSIKLKENSTIENFKGFLLQARRNDTSKNLIETIGNFTGSSSDATQTKCGSSFGNALTHYSNGTLEPRTEVIAEWLAPGVAQGPLQFRATVVSEFQVYWVQERSDAIHVAPSACSRVISSGLVTIMLLLLTL